ncbi:MAG: signal peptidase II [Paracoccaceae bacterium]
MKRVALAALAVFALDQLTKIAVVHGLNLIDRGVIEVVPRLVTFRMAWNRGVNFGLFANDAGLMKWLLIIVALAISAWVWLWIRRSRAGKWAQISAGVLIGGAIGNVVDRLAYGAVADFLNVSCCGIENPYAFNVADIAIFAGALGLVLFTGKDTPASGAARKPRRKTP